MNKFENVFDYRVIYVFEIPDEKHRGLIKIGDTKLETKEGPDKLQPNSKLLNQAAKDRIKQYTNTAGVSFNLLHTELAIKTVPGKDGTLELRAFRDHEVHKVLTNSNIKKVKLKDSTSREWFRIDFATAKKAIDAVKVGQKNLSGEDISHVDPIEFRPEQIEVIEKTVKKFEKSNNYLWYAKMRFGKTLCALEVVKRMGFEKTIITTHRPVVNASWYEDFEKIFYGLDEYIYGSKANGYTVEELIEEGKKFIYFASIQDLRGSEQVGGKFGKNQTIFNLEWDCVIVDEAHEGTTTMLGDEVINALVKQDSEHDTKFLALSGTPFNILRGYENDEVYTWDYIREQEAKEKWPLEHFGDSNPYEELPQLRIYTYNLDDIVKGSDYIAFEDKAFNFGEFFRVWTGDAKKDMENIPTGTNVGDFVHESDVLSFLNLMTKEDENSWYPFSNEEYRELFKHTFWMVPGVKEARALSVLMQNHSVFGNGAFNIVNVAGDGNPEDPNEEALGKVKKAIADAGEHEYTITLSCGKLTTGVTVKEWTAVFMLAGSYATSAANYLQTIFRVQSPCNINGKIKECAYVFDFAPDRTLKMVANAVAVSGRAGKTTGGDKIALGKFLNYCPVISISGSKMQEYSTNRLLQQLKKAYAERAVQTGFDDVSIYNDELLKLDKVDLKKFDNLAGIIGKTKASHKTNEIDINKQGLTDEEYEEQEDLKGKKKKELTTEEKKRLEELKRARKVRNDAISILRGISIRMPLMIYGADVDFDEDIGLNKFIEMVDNSSWDEFMPNGVTKSIFKDFMKYYDEEVFIAAGRRIRNITKLADGLDPTERVIRIASLFSCFKNPDKETVLTPWRVVNMHISDCLGGYDFFDEEHKEMIKEPRFVNQGKVTTDVFGDVSSKVLEINSKTGLYPLYSAYSIYRHYCEGFSEEELTVEKKQELWEKTVKDNVYVVCKTPMAKMITKRTLIGYKDCDVNTHYFNDLINQFKEKSDKILAKIMKPNYWKKEGKTMRFNAIIGNPPYQIMDEGNRNSATPVYQHFVLQSKKLNPDYLSMITPSRWFAGGKGLDSFRESMLSDTRIKKITDYTDSTVCFQGVDIAGGINYFLWDKGYDGQCEVTSIRGDSVVTMMRDLGKYDIFVRNNMSIRLIDYIVASTDAKMNTVVGIQDTFGIRTFVQGTEEKEREDDLQMARSIKGNQLTFVFIPRETVRRNENLVNKWKVVIGRSVPRNGEVGVDPSVGYRAITTVHVFRPGMVFTDTYLLLNAFDDEKEARNFAHYMTLKVPRFLLHETYSSMSISKDNFRFVPLLNYDRTWTDEELYDRYRCTDDERAMIEQMMRPLEYEVH